MTSEEDRKLQNDIDEHYRIEDQENEWNEKKNSLTVFVVGLFLVWVLIECIKNYF